MEALKYRVVTTGEVHSGFSVQEVQNNLIGLCKHDKNRVERILSGDLFVFISDIDLITARRHKSSLDQIGIVCLIEPTTPVTRNHAINAPQPALPAPPSAELTLCPKCGAAYNGEAVCASCGIVPTKYLERQRLEERVLDTPIEKSKGSKRVMIYSLLLLFCIGLLCVQYLMPKDFKYEVSDWVDSLSAPNFEHPLGSFAGQTQDDIIREYKDRGYKVHCYGTNRPSERVTDNEDYVCWFPIRSAYNNIPAKHVTFFFSKGTLNHARLVFPYSSFEQVQKYLEKALVNERRLDTVPGVRKATDTYGEPVMTWEVKGGWIQTSAKATPGHTVLVLWIRKDEGNL